jgi:putative copper resistance protein D
VADFLSVALRTLSLLLCLQAVGVAFFVAVFSRSLSSSAAAIRRLGFASAIFAIVLIAGHYVLEAARMADELAGVFDGSLQKAVLHSSSGAAFAVRILGLFLVAFGLRRQGPLATAVAAVGATIATAAFALTGHTAVHPARWLLAPALLLHLLIVAFWLGALLPLNLASCKESGEVSAKLVEQFSATASWLVPVILLAGLAMTALLARSLGVFREPYGLLLLAKLGGFLALMVLAALNRWRLSPAMTRGERYASRAFRRSLLAEYSLIVAVLGATAVMTTFFSPE